MDDRSTRPPTARPQPLGQPGEPSGQVAAPARVARSPLDNPRPPRRGSRPLQGLPIAPTAPATTGTTTRWPTHDPDPEERSDPSAWREAARPRRAVRSAAPRTGATERRSPPPRSAERASAVRSICAPGGGSITRSVWPPRLRSDEAPLDRGKTASGMTWTPTRGCDRDPYESSYGYEATVVIPEENARLRRGVRSHTRRVATAESGSRGRLGSYRGEALGRTSRPPPQPSPTRGEGAGLEARSANQPIPSPPPLWGRDRVGGADWTTLLKSGP
jgi:hypothetical protein